MTIINATDIPLEIVLSSSEGREKTNFLLGNSEYNEELSTKDSLEIKTKNGSVFIHMSKEDSVGRKIKIKNH